MLLSAISHSGSLQAADQQGGGSNFLLLGLMAVVLIVFLILPQRRRQKMQQQMQKRQDAMGPGTRVMTQFGVFGTIVSVDRESNRAVIEVAPKTEITVHLGAVTTVLDENGQVPGTPEAARAAAARGAVDEQPEAAGTERTEFHGSEAAGSEHERGDLGGPDERRDGGEDSDRGPFGTSR